MYGYSGADSDREIDAIWLEKVNRNRNSGRNRKSRAEITS